MRLQNSGDQSLEITQVFLVQRSRGNAKSPDAINARLVIRQVPRSGELPDQKVQSAWSEVAGLQIVLYGLLKNVVDKRSSVGVGGRVADASAHSLAQVVQPTRRPSFGENGLFSLTVTQCQQIVGHVAKGRNKLRERLRAARPNIMKSLQIILPNLVHLLTDAKVALSGSFAVI